MSTFFSSTDTATLKEEGRDRNNFVSLIVNNAGTYTAAITRRLKSKAVKESLTYEFFGEGLREEEWEYETTADIIEWFYLKIEKEKEDYSFVDMAARLEELKKAKAEKPKATSYSTTPFSSYNVYNKEISIKSPETTTNNVSTTSDDILILDYETNQVNKDIIKSLVLQIITGSILMSKESKIDINKWVTSMPSMYEKRFGKGHDGFSLFQAWADVYTEYITWYIIDSDLEEKGLDQTEIQALYSFYLVKELKKFPHNIYLKEYINALEKYII